jgi:hypothetical protein
MLPDSRGQILVLTGLLLTILLLFAALLVDGGQGLLTRRQFQNATDAAALSGANVVQGMDPKGCSPAPLGAPYPEVVEAVMTSLATNLPGYDLSDVKITCPGDRNIRVRVEIEGEIPTFFGRIINGDDRLVAAKATARHGRDDGGEYNIVLLDLGPPHTSGWPQARDGCPSLQLNGGVSLTLQGSVQVNSACLEAAGGAFATKGGSASLTLSPGAFFRIHGEYKRQSLTLNPPPEEHQRRIPDPLAGLDHPPLSSPTLQVQRTSKWIINGDTRVLYPGIYRGGIELRSSAVALLKPGIYVIEGGGLNIGAQAAIRAIPNHLEEADLATWDTDCVATQCGVLIYNTSGASALGEVKVNAGATVQLRAFNPDAPTQLEKDGATFIYGEAWEELRHLLFWQAAAPVPDASYRQPPMQLSGGGSIFMSGTIYAPSALISMGGTSGGGGGDVVDLTLQFVAWDLEFSGNSSFIFRYNSDTFVLPLDYGLVE